MGAEGVREFQLLTPEFYKKHKGKYRELKGNRIQHPLISHFDILIILNYSSIRGSQCKEGTLTSSVPLKAGTTSPTGK